MAFLLFLTFLAFPCFLPAQDYPAPVPDPIAPSSLASENLSRVAASAAQVDDLLRKEPGLLVELKRWVAKEATDRGQILDDAELTDQAIFDRLTRELEFRSLATRLLQRYGYLMPKLNPDSEAARDHEILVSERTRRLHAAIEEENAQGEKNPQAELQRVKECSGRECAERAQPQIPQQTRDNYIEKPEIPNRAVGASSSPQMVQTIADSGSYGIRSSSPAATTTNLGDASQIITSDLALAEPSKASSTDRKHTPAAQPADNGDKDIPGRTRLLAKTSPYADIPSLYDMYVQASSRSQVLERFGLDVFRNGTPDSGSYPMDLPVGPDYVVGPGDGLAIDLWGGVAQRLYRTVDREGRLSLPEVGPVLVSGRTMTEVQQTVQHILRTQYRDVSADISLSRLRTVRVYVVGDVAHPGAYDISSLSTPLNALFAAGGCTPEGSLRSLKHFRGKQLIEIIDAYDLLLRGVRADLKRLEDGDTLLVSPMGPQVTVEGMVRRPAIYELHEEKNLAEVLDLAGGILPAAALRHIEVQRLEAHQKRSMLSLDISETADSASLAKQLESFAMQSGDVVHIFPIAPVVPVFKQQLRENQPLTITHPGIRRFFMVTREAVALVLQAFAIGANGDILVLDMGDPVEILGLARTLIRLSGKPEHSVQIRFTGLREGEKLEEELFYSSEDVRPTACDRIKCTRGTHDGWSLLQQRLEELRAILPLDSASAIREKIREIVPEYSYSSAAASENDSQKSVLAVPMAVGHRN
jgi:protein involved in polysaccharide export with SLBB domain